MKWAKCLEFQPGFIARQMPLRRFFMARSFSGWVRPSRSLRAVRSYWCFGCMHPEQFRNKENNMNLIANILVVLVAVLHLGFLALEMFFWDHPVGRNTFKMTPEYSKAS